MCLPNHKSMVQQMFHDFIEEGMIDDATVSRYVSPHYVQWVNGERLDYVAFRAHLQKQRELVVRMKVLFSKLAEELDTIFSNHIVDVCLKDGTQLRFQVIAQFTVSEGRITACDELTRLLAGEAENADLGSRL